MSTEASLGEITIAVCIRHHLASELLRKTASASKETFSNSVANSMPILEEK
jgi:hypothetical protein